jgi:glycosyltransferase involved in cell wall biosynthesis
MMLSASATCDATRRSREHRKPAMLRDAARIGYVAEVFPRHSETFIVTELLAHEQAGLDVEVFSLRRSSDHGAHAAHARLRAPITEVPEEVSIGGLLDELGTRPLGVAEELVDWARAEDPRDVVQALRLAALVRERGIDHLHAHFANVAATVTRMAARLAGVPYSITAHAKDIFHDDVRPEQLRRVLEDAAAVVTVSEFNVAHLRAVCPGVTERLHRVYNGLELERFPFTSPATRLPRIVGVGRLVEKQGFGDLVAACALLAAQGRRFECRIVGGGEFEGQLRSAVDRLGLQHVVTFVGPVSQETVREEITAAAALAAPCVVGADGDREGLPTVLLEAMALGTPCIATDVTGIPEVLLDDRTGLAVAQRDPAGLADALGRLLDDEELRVLLARAARRLIEARFDAEETSACWRAAVLGAPTPAGEEVNDHAEPLRVH